MHKSQPSVRSGHRPASRSVLLVEDDDAVRRGLNLLLTARGYKVRSYSSAVGLAQDAEALRSDCLVADLMMPTMDAVALLSDLRAVGWTGHAILISGFLDQQWQTRALAAGFDAVLPKPISETVLVRTVEQLTS